MAYKLSFKYQRNRYSGTMADTRSKVEADMKKLLNEKKINCQRFYSASRDSIKVVFPNEIEVNKIMDKAGEYTQAGFEPRMSMALKAARTVFCAGFDQALLTAYTKENIKDQLLGNEWEVRDVYIMKSGKTFKIEMNTTAEARKFIQSNSTSIGGIALPQQTKEQEIDPTIPQCWDCGKLYPNHVGNHCPNLHRCLKCNQNHSFHECDLPREEHEMSDSKKTGDTASLVNYEENTHP